MKKIKIFKKVFKDPYLDWFLVLVFLFLGIIFGGIFGANSYKKAINYLNDENRAVASVKRVNFDEKKMSEILEDFRNRKKIFSDQSSIKVLLKDPSI